MANSIINTINELYWRPLNRNPVSGKIEFSLENFSKISKRISIVAFMVLWVLGRALIYSKGILLLASKNMIITSHLIQLLPVINTVIKPILGITLIAAGISTLAFIICDLAK
jgi:hypothetical protein